jgi:hypothetical protein
MGHAPSQQLELMTNDNVCQFPRGFPAWATTRSISARMHKATSLDFSSHDTNILGARFTTPPSVFPMHKQTNKQKIATDRPHLMCRRAGCVYAWFELPVLN